MIPVNFGGGEEKRKLVKCTQTSAHFDLLE